MEVPVIENDRENILSVIKIPNIKNKPYVIGMYKNCQNYIPVRKDGSINTATRLELDEMYAERNYLELEYDIEVHKISSEPTFNLAGQYDLFFRLSIDFSIHNKGSRAIAIKHSSLSSDTEILTTNNLNLWEGTIYLNLLEQQKSELYFSQIPLVLDVKKRSTVRIDYDSESFNVSSQRHLQENRLGQLLHELRRYPKFEFKVSFSTVEGESFQYNISFNSGR